MYICLQFILQLSIHSTSIFYFKSKFLIKRSYQMKKVRITLTNELSQNRIGSGKDWKTLEVEKIVVLIGGFSVPDLSRGIVLWYGRWICDRESVRKHQRKTSFRRLGGMVKCATSFRRIVAAWNETEGEIRSRATRKGEPVDHSSFC